MNLLMVGNGKGSFTMRGLQLGGALGARVVSVPSDDDMRWADVVVLIKRAGQAWAALAQRFGKPVVWDALDFWRQPTEHGLNEHQAKVMFHAQIKAIKPALVIGATQAMASAVEGRCEAVYLPHHSWQGLSPTPAREVVSCVGYEGNPTYLGRWRDAVQAECARRGWTFVINPPDLRQVDIFVAFRDGSWDGWMPRQWKSGVKVVNAVAAGRPIILNDCSADGEISHFGDTIEAFSDLSQALDRCADMGEIAVTHGEQMAKSYTLSAVADRYGSILQTVRQTCAA